MGRVLVLLALLAALALPAGAVAQSDPFAPVPVQPSQQQTQAPVTAEDDGGDGLEGWQQALIFAAGGILILGIAWAIIGDARQRAPKDTESRQESRARNEAEHHRRKAKARAAGKRAKAARRRNRQA